MNSLNVSCIQRFSTGDGDGIRTTVFLKGCNLKCPWCHNPENQSPDPQTLAFKNGKTVKYGEMIPVCAVLSDVLEDIEFFRASGGGVTVSGGEPLLQSKAVSELLKKLKEQRINTLIDTAGCVPYQRFEDVLEFTDTFYYDYKTAEAGKYKSIGGDKDTVLYNLEKVISDKKHVHIRIPLIPGFNMSEDDSAAICADLIKAGVKNVDLLPYHRLGSSKYEALGIDYEYKSIKPSDKEIIEKIKEFYGKNFTVRVE